MVSHRNFPTFLGTMLGYDHHLSLSMPSFRSVTDTLFVPSVRVPFPARYRSGTFALTPGRLGLSRYAFFRVADKETSGSPKFPGYPLELMPCSSTPVVSSALALAHSGLLPSVSMRTSAFPPYTLAFISTNNNIRLSTIIQISGLIHTACFLAYLGFRLPLPDLPARFATALLATL